MKRKWRWTAAYLNVQTAAKDSRSLLVKRIKDCARSVKAMSDDREFDDYFHKEEPNDLATRLENVMDRLEGHEEQEIEVAQEIVQYVIRRLRDMQEVKVIDEMRGGQENCEKSTEDRIEEALDKRTEDSEELLAPDDLAVDASDTEVGFPVDDLIEQVTLLCQQAYREGVPAGRIQYLMECEAETWEAVANDEIAIDEVDGSGR